MQKVVDFEVACERVGMVLATILFRDRLPDDFWESLDVEECFWLMRNYPVDRWHTKGEGDNDEAAFRKQAYQRAQARLLSIVDASKSFEELERIYTLTTKGREVKWWVTESSATYYDVCVRVLNKMAEIEPKTTELWKKIRGYASSVIQTSWSNTHDRQRPQGTAKIVLEQLRARAATEIFNAAVTAEDWHYLYSAEGVSDGGGASYSGRYLYGLTPEQHVVVSQRVASFFREIFGDEETAQMMAILEDLPEDAAERDILLDRMEQSDWYYPLVCGYVEQDSDRFKKTLSRMKKENTFSCWMTFCQRFSREGGKFYRTCLERSIELATTRDELRSVLHYVDKKNPRRAGLQQKLGAAEAAAKERGRRGHKHKKSSGGSEATLN